MGVAFLSIGIVWPTILSTLVMALPFVKDGLAESQVLVGSTL